MANTNTNATRTAARRRLQATIEKRTTEQLLTVARALNTQTSREAILAASFVDNELERRLPEAEFLALMDELEAELMSV